MDGITSSHLQRTLGLILGGMWARRLPRCQSFHRASALHPESVSHPAAEANPKGLSKTFRQKNRGRPWPCSINLISSEFSIYHHPVASLGACEPPTTCIMGGGRRGAVSVAARPARHGGWSTGKACPTRFPQWPRGSSSDYVVNIRVKGQLSEAESVSGPQTFR